MGSNKSKIFLLILILKIIEIVAFKFIQIDDAYIFHTNEENIAEGKGYQFNFVEKMNATTSFVYTFLLSIVFRLIKSNLELITQIGNVISVLSLLITSLILSKIFANDLMKRDFSFAIKKF